MTRYLLALAPVLAFTTDAAAQLPVLPGQVSGGVVGPPPPLPPPPAYPGPTPTPGPPVITPGAGFYKSNGVLVGADGWYPYDSGYWLLGGTDGFVRSTGHFRMVYPEPPPGVGPGGPTVAPRHPHPLHRLFHHPHHR
ncbi:MAG: hypothetical protein C0501_11010 [Isosphaera sp.]|nr:hypothetical protein [Isosphaera sp.]